MLLDRQDTLRANVRYARMRLGLDFDELGAKVGLKGKSLSNFESSSTKLSALAINRVANALGVTPEDLNDPGFRLRFQAASTVKPEPTPAPEPKFEDFVQLLRQMTPAQRDAIIEVMRVMADGNLKKI